jgi:hypothetical protein
MMPMVELSPPNSVILVMDPSVGEIPQKMSGLIGTTSTCIAVGTLSEHDGPTQISLCVGIAPPTQSFPALGSVLETPSHRIAVCTVENKCLLELPVEGDRTRVVVVVNDLTEPDKIVVWVSAA